MNHRRRLEKVKQVVKTSGLACEGPGRV